MFIRKFNSNKLVLEIDLFRTKSLLLESFSQYVELTVSFQPQFDQYQIFLGRFFARDAVQINSHKLPVGTSRSVLLDLLVCGFNPASSRTNWLCTFLAMSPIAAAWTLGSKKAKRAKIVAKIFSILISQQGNSVAQNINYWLQQRLGSVLFGF